MSALEEPFLPNSPTSGDPISAIRKTIINDLKIDPALVSDADCVAVARVSEIVGTRGCRLSACALAAITKQTGNDKSDKQVKFGLDGSLVEFYPRFEERVRAAVRELLGEEVEKRVEINLAKDGSGVGGESAFIVARSSSSEVVPLTLCSSSHSLPPLSCSLRAGSEGDGGQGRVRIDFTSLGVISNMRILRLRVYTVPRPRSARVSMGALERTGRRVLFSSPFVRLTGIGSLLAGPITAWTFGAKLPTAHPGSSRPQSPFARFHFPFVARALATLDGGMGVGWGFPKLPITILRPSALARPRVGTRPPASSVHCDGARGNGGQGYTVDTSSCPLGLAVAEDFFRRLLGRLAH